MNLSNSVKLVNIQVDDNQANKEGNILQRICQSVIVICYLHITMYICATVIVRDIIYIYIYNKCVQVLV